MAASEASSWAFHVGSSTPWTPLVLIIVVAVASAAFVRLRGLLLLLLLGGAAGFVAGWLFWHSWSLQTQMLAARTSSRWEAEVVGDSREGRFGARSDLKCPVDGVDLKITAMWPKEETPPEAGELLEFYGALRPPESDEFGRLSHQGGVVGSVSARAVSHIGRARSLRGALNPLRTRASAAIRQVPGPGGDLLAGVLLGDRRRLTGTQADSDFRTTGLTHLVAVSGGHLVVVAALATMVLRALRVGPKTVAVSVTSLLGLYVVVSGVQPSAVRAWLMAAVIASVGSSGRRGDGVGSLSAAVIVALTVWPPTAFDLGFRLSVLAVAGLLLFARLSERWVSEALPQWFAAAASPIALTLVAQLATMPLTISTFRMVSLVSPIANILVSPLVSLLLVLGLVGLLVSAVTPGLSHLVLLSAGAAGHAAADVAGWLAGWPHAAVPLSTGTAVLVAVTLLGGIAVWVFWPQPSTRIARGAAVLVVLACSALAIGPPQLGGAQIVVLDVGQGDAILIRDRGESVLVATGPSQSALREALGRH
ncbi:MAG TPA: ComEC/Rec2 family competence protein, partial [Coriobacteriia bacterium]|nr:ComEC/Rec2 family competence protein [Coriobacteriia bacterium]